MYSSRPEDAIRDRYDIVIFNVGKREKVVSLQLELFAIFPTLQAAKNDSKWLMIRH